MPSTWPLVMKSWLPNSFRVKFVSTAAHVWFGNISRMKYLDVLTHCAGEGEGTLGRHPKDSVGNTLKSVVGP